MSDCCYASLVDLLEDKAQIKSDFPLYTFLPGGTQENKILTYGELAEKAKKIAVMLQKTTSPNERVIIIYPPGLDLIAAFLGCLYAGVIVIPVYPPNSRELVAKLQHIIKNSGAQVILTTQDIIHQLRKLRVAKWLNRNFILDKAALYLIGATYKKSLQLLDWEFEKMHFIATDNLAHHTANGWKTPNLSQNNLAFLQYTSGSTGKPKGVMVSHGNLLHNLAVIEARNGLSTEDVSVSWLPPYHDMGLIGGILQPMFTGYQVKLMSPLTFLQRPAVWLETMSEHKATYSGGPNFAYDLCINKISEMEKSFLDLSHWKVAATGAEPIRQSTIEHFSNSFKECGFDANAFHPCYGLAESTLMVTSRARQEQVLTQVVSSKALSQGRVSYCDETDPNARVLVSCGKSAEDFHVVIVNPETLNVCSDGHIGEIWVAAKSVTHGYWELPEESKYCFQAKIIGDDRTFLRTGDYGYFAEGALFVTGRLKDIIIIRGRNYYPHDLEHSIYNCHPEVRVNCCAIFSVDEHDHESLVVVQEIKDNVNGVTAEEIIKIIRNTILKFHGINAETIVLVGRKSVPKTTSGKTQRLLCKKRYLEGKLQIHYIDNINPNHTPATVHSITSAATGGASFSQLLNPIFKHDITTLDQEKSLSELGLNMHKLRELQYALFLMTHRTISLEYLLMDPKLKEILTLIESKSDYVDSQIIPQLFD